MSKDLQEEISKAETQKEVLEHRLQRLKNRESYLDKGERRKRTHHLCNIGGAVDVLLPVSGKMSKTEFYEFMEVLFNIPEVQKLIREKEKRYESEAES